MEDEGKVSYFFLGLGVGIAVGILFAPKSGSETRELIRTKADDSREYLRRRSEELREQAGEAVERSKTALRTQKDQLSAAVEAGKQAYKEAVTPRTNES
jgi:gas vesicle protein